MSSRKFSCAVFSRSLSESVSMWVPNDERRERRSKLLIYFRYRHFNVYSISYINFNARIFLDFLSSPVVTLSSSLFLRWHRILGALRVFAPADWGMPSCVASARLGKVAMCHRINFKEVENLLGSLILAFNESFSEKGSGSACCLDVTFSPKFPARKA